MKKGMRHDCFRILSKTLPAMSQTKANTFFAIPTTSKKRQNSYLFSKNNRWPLLALHMANARNTIRQRFTHEILNFDTTQFSWISETRHSSRQSNYPVHSTWRLKLVNTVIENIPINKHFIYLYFTIHQKFSGK